MQPHEDALGARSPRIRILPQIVVTTDPLHAMLEEAGSNASSPQAQSSSNFWSQFPQRPVEEPEPSTSGLEKEKQQTEAQESQEATVLEFLHNNRSFLHKYVIDHVAVYDIHRWLSKKLLKNTHVPGDEINFFNPKSSKVDKKEIFLDFVNRLEDNADSLPLLGEVARLIVAAVQADACRVFKIFPDDQDFVQYFNVLPSFSSSQTLKWFKSDEIQAELVLEVAITAGILRLSQTDDAERFPKAPSDFNSKSKPSDVNHVMYQPIFDADGQCCCVVELWRRQLPFSSADESNSANALVWGSLLLHYCSYYINNKCDYKLSNFLLSVVQEIFEELVSLDQLIKRILKFAQKLVYADRASLFLVDNRNNELVSTVFDLKFEPGSGKDIEKKEIRMPINKGIAGHVALSGTTMNIPDAYSDYRFNREIDEKTGYKTISILCMPIKVQGKVIGVVQMVNKLNEKRFRFADEMAFKTFSTIFGLAIHHARLYDRIMRKEQRYRVTLEVLSYHNTCKENEVETIMKDKEQVDTNLNDYYLDPYELNEIQKCKAVITMFDVLFDISKFDIMTVTRFILTVKKNYRTVPYHNFDHGWSVAHSMFVILKNDVLKRYSYKVRLALFVASLCHDLDHRGYTNKYMSETASPLAAMYTTSTLEHHHFNTTVTILQQDGHNIFGYLTSEEYKDLLGCIRQCILATDLAAFFPNLAKIKALHEGAKSTKFNWHNSSHRDLAMAISMTSADLSASAKPWEIQIKTVKVIFEEFYDQGDKEREAGRTPIPMMDRNQPDEQPASQVGFLSQICIPCYKILYTVLPKTKPMYVMALKNLHNWKEKARRVHHKLKNNGEDAEDSEIEDVSEDVLVGGEIDMEEEDNNQEIPIDAVVLVETFGDENSPEEVSLEDNEAEVPEKIGGALRKDLENLPWIDQGDDEDEDDDVVILNKNTLAMFKKHIEKK